MANKDFLIEIGTEELPPMSLYNLAQALADNVTTELAKNKLTYETIKFYATPRRLAVLITKLDTKQPDQILERRGPALQAAYDKSGKPTKAALGFAKFCNTRMEQLTTLETDKGSWLFYKQNISGTTTTKLLPNIITTALKTLPITRPMRWSDHDFSFIRPVQWLVMLYGKDIVNTEIFDIKTDRKTYGHRFHHPGAIALTEPNAYEATLAEQGHVIADFDKRKAKIRKLTINKSKSAIIDEQLLNEVTGLVEWPVALMGKFAPHFLELPTEVLISTMQKHQKCFPIRNQNNFITISNIESKKPAQVIAGNERVINARLADAEFFYNTDLKHPLANNVERLKGIIFQTKLGTMYDKTKRITAIATYIAQQIGADLKHVERASLLAKTDLVTFMVNEFPELQGIMGNYYALAHKEPKQVALALQEQYLPRFAGDSLPQSKIGCALAIADRIDTIVGIFSINEAPTGAKDPFGLRRAALGILRIIIEKELNLDLAELIKTDAVLNFMFERLRSYYLEQNITPQTFNSVLARTPTAPLDFDKRIKAVTNFQKLPEAEALATANKRVRNILKNIPEAIYTAKPDPKFFTETAERNLYKLIMQKQQSKQQDYTKILVDLAELKIPVDKFFDDVMVMVEDEKLRNNRLKLLHQLRQLFLKVADISLF